MRFLWAAISLLLVTSAYSQERLPVPVGPEVAKAEAQIKELFKADLLKTKPADRLALAAKLQQLARETANDPAARYVLLREARDLAAKSGGAELAFQAADEIRGAFAVGNEGRTAVAELLATAPYTATAAAQTADTLMLAGDAAKEADDWDTALAMYKSAELIARKAQSPPILVSAQTKFKQAIYYRTESAKLKDYLAVLKQMPDDPAANLGAGRFYCLLRDDWLQGTAMLLKGSDEKLKAAAKKDLQAGGGTVNDLLLAGDAWYDLLSNADPALKPAIHARALFWYTAAEPALTGLDKVKATKRLAELATQSDARTAKVWIAISKAIENKQLTKVNAIGGAFGKVTYEDMPEKPGILIGFNVMGTQGKPPSVIQPIYLTSQGELKGRVIGTPNKGDQPAVIKAKPGYAVGAINTRGLGWLDAVQPVFMRITERGLDPKDAYDGPYIGTKAGNDTKLGGEGNLIIGIHGRTEDRGRLCAVSLISIGANPDSVK